MILSRLLPPMPADETLRSRANPLYKRLRALKESGTPLCLLEGVAAHVDSARKERRTIHAVGDGTFIVDGRKLDRRKMMASKIPAGG